jgi:hypothetical protein
VVLKVFKLDRFEFRDKAFDDVPFLICHLSLPIVELALVARLELVWLVEKKILKDQSHKAAYVPLRASLGNGLNYIFNDILLVFAAIQALVQGFGPDDAMDQLLRFLSDCAHRKALLLVLVRTLVALSFTLKDGRH